MLFPYSRVACTAFCDLLQGSTPSHNAVRLLLGSPRVSLRPGWSYAPHISPRSVVTESNLWCLHSWPLGFAAKNLGVVRPTLVVFHHNYPCPPLRSLASSLGSFWLARLSCRCHSYAVVTALNGPLLASSD